MTSWNCQYSTIQMPNTKWWAKKFRFNLICIPSLQSQAYSMSDMPSTATIHSGCATHPSFVTLADIGFVFHLFQHCTDNVFMIWPFLWTLEDLLNASITCLPDRCASTRYKVNHDVWVVFQHPGIKLFQAIHWLDIYLPDRFLAWR